jgi:hypothetical protein
MIARRLALAAVVASGVLTLDGAAMAGPPSLVCSLPQGSEKLAPTARRGFIDHLLQYPAVQLATRTERRRARHILEQLEASAVRGGWRDIASAERAGFDTGTAPRKPGDTSVHYFHAERHQEPRRGRILDVTRPKALIYANAPGRPLVLVGAMWSTRDGEVGPTPAGPILRWHSHVVCKEGTKRGLKPLPGGRCPPGAQLTQGASEMLHVWFTRDLRSAFAIRAPEPELCVAGSLPRSYCKRL